MQDTSASAHRPHTMGDSSGAGSSRRSVTMKDGSGGSSSSRRQSLNRRNSREPASVKLEQSSSRRMSSGRLRVRAKLMHVDGSKSETDVTGHQPAQKVKGRQGQPLDADLNALSRSPSKPSPITSKGRRLKSSSGSHHLILAMRHEAECLLWEIWRQETNWMEPLGNPKMIINRWLQW
jgi:hypothetical protein